MARGSASGRRCWRNTKHCMPPCGLRCWRRSGARTSATTPSICASRKTCCSVTSNTTGAILNRTWSALPMTRGPLHPQVERPMARPWQVCAGAVPAPCPELPPLASEIDPELAQLAVQVGALQAGLLGDAGHGAPFALEVELEIGFLEIVAGLTQRTVQVKVLV